MGITLPVNSISSAQVPPPIDADPPRVPLVFMALSGYQRAALLHGSNQAFKPSTQFRMASGARRRYQ
jgi:hypothetical protein